MKMEVKMLIKQLNARTKEGMIKELRESECADAEIQALVDETINIVEDMSNQELIQIKTEILSVY